jgi:hypothetical protein
MVFSRRMHTFGSAAPSRILRNVTPENPFGLRGGTASSSMLGGRAKLALELSYFVLGVVGSYDHALVLTPFRKRDQSRAPSLRRRSGHRHPQYYEPLGLPLDTTPLHLRLIGAAFARRGRRGGSLLFRTRLSLRAVFPTPGVPCAPPVLPRAVCCLRRDMTGSATPPFGSYLTRLQSSRSRIRPAALLPSAEAIQLPEGFRRSAQTDGSHRTPGACYAAPRQAYRGGTPTRKSGTASRLPRGSFVQDAP